MLLTHVTVSGVEVGEMMQDLPDCAWGCKLVSFIHCSTTKLLCCSSLLSLQKSLKGGVAGSDAALSPCRVEKHVFPSSSSTESLFNKNAVKLGEGGGLQHKRNTKDEDDRKCCSSQISLRAAGESWR
ncbi:hypothetical protein NQZ68_002031 [Dissostichus eleginoides]|nr:hypothetical protein NQZ68_002031 [Dissostichus eleginoides]